MPKLEQVSSEPRTSTPDDLKAELRAMTTIVRSLSRLGARERKRVLDFLLDKYVYEPQDLEKVKS